MVDLSDKVCLVTGASRGIGRGIALQLVAHGATCYITGRSLQSLKLVEDEVKSRDLTGKLLSVECDHTCDKSVEDLFQQIASDQNRQLDLVVNNAFGGVQFMADNDKTYFWDLEPTESWDKINNVGLRGNYICTVFAARLMVPRRKGLIINVSSGAAKTYAILPQFGIGKAGQDRMVKDCAYELSKYNIAFVSLWPGIVKTEFVAAEVKKVFPNNNLSVHEKAIISLYGESESPEFCGKAVVHLLNDKNIMRRSGQIELTTDLGSEFNFKDTDGSTPVAQRSIRHFMMIAGPKSLASCIPNWLKIPKFFFFWLMGVAQLPLSKVASKYE